MKDALTMEKQRYWDSCKEENSSVPNAAFSFYTWMVEHFENSDHVASITQSPLSGNLIKCSEWGETFIKFHAYADSSYWCETSRSKWALAWVEMTFSWMDRTRWVHEVACELITTWLKSGSTHVVYLLRISDTWALIGQMVGACETTMMWLDDRHELGSTLDWGWMTCKHYLGKSSKVLKRTRWAFDH
jgi:hypothetical protein